MASKKETKPKKTSSKSGSKKDAKKTPVAPIVDEVEENEEEIGSIETKSKIKKPAEIDAADILPEIDEKVVDEENPLLAGEDEEDEVASLDDEDLNPFGDKWEQ